MASIVIDVKVGKKEKKHKKKKTVDKNDNHDMQTVSCISSQPQKKMPTVNERKKVSNKQSVTKFVSINNAHKHIEQVNSATMNTPCQDTSDFPVKRKCGKKRKKTHDLYSETNGVLTQQNTDIERAGESVQKSQKKERKIKQGAGSDSTAIVNKIKRRKSEGNKHSKMEFITTNDTPPEHVNSALLDTPCLEMSDFPVKRKREKKREKPQDEHIKNTEHNTDTEPTGDLVQKLRKKKKKIKRDVGSDSTTDVNTGHGDSTAASSSQYRALEYLRTWKCAPDCWTFRKVRQVWLLQHMYDLDKVISVFIYKLEHYTECWCS